MEMTPQSWPDWYDGRHINEVLFCQQFLDKHPMKCVRGRLFTVDGLIEDEGQIGKLFIAKPDGSPQRRDRMSANFGQLIRHLEMPHIRFHDLRHTAATNMHQLTGDFYTVGEILGHTLKGIGISLGISTNLEAVTAQYVDVRLERKQSVLQTYHKALQPKTTVTGKEAGQETSKKAKKKSSEMEL